MFDSAPLPASRDDTVSGQMSVRQDLLVGRLLPLLLLGVSVSCHGLPPGSMDSVHPTSDGPRKGNVYLLRGWQDLYSAGIDRLAIRLRQNGLRAQAYRAAQWHELAETIGRRYRNAPSAEPLVLIGFSYGADDALLVAQYLDRSGQSVDLIVTIDPVTPPRVPGNVRVCYNYFQTNGIWDALPWLRGTPLKSNGRTRLTNVDIRQQRHDLLEPATSHATIAANPKLHAAIIQQVLSVCVHRSTTPTATQWK